MEAGYEVFLNHAGRHAGDTAIVKQLASELERYGVRPWLAERELRGVPPTAWPPEIDAALATVPAFAVCLGEGLPGQWGRREWEVAAARAERDPSLTLLTVVLPGGSPDALPLRLPQAYRDRPWVDLRGGVEDPVELVAALRGVGGAVESRSLAGRRREALLQRLVGAVREGVSPIAVTGPTGVGKSTLVTAAAERLADDCEGGAVIVAVGSASATEVAGRALQALGETSPKKDPLRSLRAILSKRRTLLVLEDVADHAVASRLIAPAPSVTIAVSRSAPVDGAGLVLEVPPLDQTEGLELLKQLVPSLVAAGAEAAMHAVASSGGLPLYLRLIAEQAKLIGSLADVGPPPAEALLSAEELAELRLERPGYAADVVGGRDRLEIGEDVRALASLIAARDVRPPLSIGLFADWGAGKTFFIEKLQEEIGERARASGPAGPWCSCVKQITFNAWHYADTNLWASLVTQIFQELARDTSPTLLERLESSQVRLEQAEREREQAERRVKNAERRRQALVAKQTEAKIRLRRARVDDLAAAAAGREARDAARELTKKLGDQVDPESMPKLAEDLATLQGRLRKLWCLLPRWAFVVLLLVLAATAILGVLAPGWVAALVGAIPTVGWVVTVAAGPVRNVLQAATIAERGAQQLADAQALEHREQEAAVAKTLAVLQGEEAVLRAQVEHERGQLAALEREQEDIRSGRALYRFIEARATADDYRRHLGLVAVVRRDFEHLEELLRAGGSAETPSIERIVLYVDDLDRCSADRVVKVLEAVHLLLALPLFAVVVAVDPRWLLRSLESHYANEMRSSANGDPVWRSDEWASTPQNYLEKIFQIPFALVPMEKYGFGRLVEHLFFGEDGAPDGRVGGRPAQAPESPPEATPPAQSGVRFAPAPERPAPADPAVAAADNLRLTRPELEFVQLLAPLLPTPRAAKRLVNTYRLIRATLGEKRLLSAGPTGGYREALLLLAIMIGSPSLAPHLFKAIQEGKATSWTALVTQFAPPAQDLERWQHLRTALDTLLAREALPQPMIGYARWVPTVSRYSFQTIRLAAAAIPDRHPAAV
jgi:hypothetical protein